MIDAATAKFLIILAYLISRAKAKEIIETSLCTGIGNPLILTPFIESGAIRVAQDLSRVPEFPGSSGVVSHSGFFTVNKTDNSNLYFWFFPAENTNPEKEPLIVWLQGGPGVSSLFGAMSSNGPFRVDAFLKLSLHPERWTRVANMLYLDNPVNTGFSFTATDQGASRNEDQIATNLYQALLQFYAMFPPFRNGQLYLAGESYAGKYAPAFAYRIHMENSLAIVKLPLRGIILINALVDPINQPTLPGDMLYQIGVIDLNEKEKVDAYESRYKNLITSRKWSEAHSVLLEAFEYFYQVTGLTDKEDYLLSKEPPDWDNYHKFINSCNMRGALHVGNQVFADENQKVLDTLAEDIPQSVAPVLAFVANNYRVLIINGLLDMLCTQVGTENYLRKLEWEGREDYRRAEKMIWKVDDSDNEVAGYVHQVGDFIQVAVRNAGHVVPYDQPRAALDAITRFLRAQSFSNT